MEKANYLNESLSFNGNIVLDGDLLKCYHQQECITVEAPNNLIRCVIEEVSIGASVNEIVENIGKIYNKDLLENFLIELLDQKILVLKKYYFIENWNLVRNPQFFHNHFSSAKAKTLAENASIKIDGFSSPTVIFPDNYNHLYNFLEDRKNVRVFSGEALSDTDISTILYSAYGVVDRKKDSNSLNYHRRVVPSAGGIYPLSMTLIQWRKTESLSEGNYSVNYGADKQVGLTNLDNSYHEFISSLIDPGNIGMAHGAIVISCDFKMICEKYGNRGVSLSLIEVGHVAQNIALTSQSRDVAVQYVGGFIENKIKKLLSRIDLEPLLVIVLGREGHSNKNKYEVDFSWYFFDQYEYTPPFHLGRARIRYNDKYTDWCWGRSDNPFLAYDKASSESFERLACDTPTKDLIWEKKSNLNGNIIDPTELIKYSDKQYFRKTFPFKMFNPDSNYPWVKVKKFGEKKEYWVLADFVFYLNSFSSSKNYRAYTHCSTSGVAAYTSLTGALERSIFELVERHYFMITWLNQIRVKEISFNSLPFVIKARINSLSNLGWNIKVLLLSYKPISTVLVFAQSTEQAITKVSASSNYECFRAIEHSLEEMEAMIATAYNSFSSSSAITPEEVSSPRDHGALYEQKKFYKNADFLISNLDIIHMEEIQSDCLNFIELEGWCNKNNMELYYKEITPEMGININNGKELYVVRSISKKLLPISFGYGLEPQPHESILNFNHHLDDIVFPHPFD